MIWIMLALAAAVLAYLEYNWSYYALRSLHFKGEADRIMAEPGETIIFRSTVETTPAFPSPSSVFPRIFPTMPG